MNLLLINKTIPGFSEFIDSINSNTKYVVYDTNTDTFNGILEQINQIGIDNFTNIGFVFENNTWGNQVFLENTNFIDVVSTNNFDEDGNLVSVTQEIIKNQTTNFIKNLVGKYQISNIDFLACSLLRVDNWKKFLT